MPYIGTQPTTGIFTELDALTASATADYALTLNGAAYNPATVNNLLVSINGVIQAGSTMSLSGSTLTVGATLSSSDVIDFVRVFGSVGTVSTPTDGSVTTAKIGNNAVTMDKLATSGTLPALNGSALTGISTASIGVGQTWTDVLSSRAKATEYQNSTSTPIQVSITFTSSFTSSGLLKVSAASGSGFVTVANADGGDYYSASAQTTHVATVQAIIPANHYYRLDDSSGGNLTVTTWAELR